MNAMRSDNGMPRRRVDTADLRAFGARAFFEYIVLPLLLCAAASLLGQERGETPFLDREFPKPGLTRFSDTGPKRIGLELDERNLIPNSGFEEWSERRIEVNPGLPGEEGLWESWLLPNGWTYQTWGGKEMTKAFWVEKTHRHPVLTTFESTDAHGGKRALNVGFGETCGWMWFGTDLFPIEPGRKYVLSMWVKGRNLGRGVWQLRQPLNVLLRLYADPKREHLTGVRAFHEIVKVSSDMGTFDWKELRWQFTVPLGVQWATLQLKPLQARGDPLILVDDISLRKVVREPDAWVFDRSAGFGNARRDGVEVVDAGLELAKVQNLITNAGFETDADKDGLPDGWKIEKCPASANLPPDPSLEAGLDNRRHTGGRALKLSGTTGIVRAVSPLLQLSEPGWYTLSLFWRNTPPASNWPSGYGSVAVHAPMDGTTSSRDLIQHATGWARESITFVYPGRDRQRIAPYDRDPGVEIALGCRGNGTVWFDDVQLEPGRRANRLAGAVHADQGEAVSEIIDLGYANSGTVSWDAAVPQGRLVQVSTRTGFTPFYDESTWTDWGEPYVDPKSSPLELRVTGVQLYLQWKAVLSRDDPKIVTAEMHSKRYPKLADVKDWRYCLDPDGKGVEGGFARPDCDEAAWKSVAGLKGERLPDTPPGIDKGAVWYRSQITLPPGVRDQKVYLCIEQLLDLGSGTRATVYVNGSDVGYRLGGNRTWLELGGVARAGQVNRIAVCVQGPDCDRFDYLLKTQVLLDGVSSIPAYAGTSPVVKSVRIAVDGPRDRWPREGDVEITCLSNGEIRPPLMPFRARTLEDYEKDVKLRALRTLAREITQDVPDEDAQILRLRKHIYALCNSTGNPSVYQLKPPNNTPYDFLHLSVKDRLTMYCTHHWQTMTDLATAVGFVVRPVTTGHMNPFEFWADNVVEYWSNKYNKWVMINTFFDNYFTCDGIPQSAADLMRAWFEDRWGEIESRAGGDITNCFRFSAEQAIGPFGWTASPPHTHANSQGWFTSVYVTDNPLHGPGVTLIRPETEPFFIDQGHWSGKMPYTTDEHALYAPINQTRLRLSFSDASCQVQAEHNMPNFDHFLYSIDSSAWQSCSKLPLQWQLNPGPNVLRMKAVNRFGLAGPESVVMLRVTRPFAEPEPFFTPEPIAPGKPKGQ